MQLGSKAFNAPEGAYITMMELNVHRALASSNSNYLTLPGLAGLSANAALGAANGTATSSSIPIPAVVGAISNTTSMIAGSQTANASGSAPAGTAENLSISGPAVHMPSVPGILANADGTNPSVAPPAYPCSLATVLIKFPPAPPANPFPHPGFLTSATKYTRSKETTTDQTINDPPSAEVTDSATSSFDDSTMPVHPSNKVSGSPGNLSNCPPEGRINQSGTPSKTRGLNFSSTFTSLSNTKAGTTNHATSASHHPSSINNLSSRPRAAFKGSTSTFIKSSDGLPLPHSLLKTFYAASTEPNTAGYSKEEGEERLFGFYTWNRTVTWVQLSPGRQSGDSLVKITFQAPPTCVSVNRFTASFNALDVIIGFSTGDLVYFDPFCARYTRFNKGGCISSSPVTRVIWLPSSTEMREGCFLSSHMDGTVIGWDKEREDFVGFIPEPWPNLSPTDARRKSTNGTSNGLRPDCSNKPLDERVHDIVVSRIPSAQATEKKGRMNPIFHWRVSQKAARDVAFSPNSQYCAVVSEDGCLRIIDFHNEKLLDTYMSYFGAFLCVSWSLDGRLVFTGGQDDYVTVYAPLEQRVIARCQGHSSFVTGLAYDFWNSDERSSRFASVSEDGKLIFWDLSSASLNRPRLQQQSSGFSAGGSGCSLNGRKQHNLTNLRPSQQREEEQRKNNGFHEENLLGSITNHHSSKDYQISQRDHCHNLTSDTKTMNTDYNSLLAIENGSMNDQFVSSRGVHLSPGRNEIAILQPVMVKEISSDPLCEIIFEKDWLIIGSRTSQIQVFGRASANNINK
ncbi:WD40-repeat-containing domain protein [Phakopsora pachyrhizi]|uniref:WD40-repeat-containing domain protein n=1 Tax=Phakopsora pachyrhizi TaxID=170000 RepID=A0AAV0APL8_PHAPC|nr:WD40-repeat-containing domain protein [Phakopsora pachyrhizi]